MFASMLGFFLTFLIVSFLFIGLIASIASFAEDKAVDVKENSVLHLTFNKPIYDRTPNNPFENYDFQKMKSNTAAGLNDILKVGSSSEAFCNKEISFSSSFFS